MKSTNLVVALLVLVGLGGSYVAASPIFPGFPFIITPVMQSEEVANIMPSIEKMISASMPAIEKMVSSSMPAIEQMVSGAMPTFDKIVSSFLQPQEPSTSPPAVELPPKAE